MQCSPEASLTRIDSDPEHAVEPLCVRLPVHEYVQDVAFVQFQVTVAFCPHAVGEEKPAWQVGGLPTRSEAPLGGMSEAPLPGMSEEPLSTMSTSHTSPFRQR